jgi:DNA-binding beta-propeller fold protein YncE
MRRIGPAGIRLLRLAGLMAGLLLLRAAPSLAGSILPGDLLFVDLDVPGLYRADPATGLRSLVSGTGEGTGVGLTAPRGLAVDAAGAVLLVDSDLGALVRIDPATGNRTVVSGAGVGSGTAFSLPFGVAVDSSTGAIYVTDAGTGSGDAAVFRIDALTGARTLVSGGGVGLGFALDNPRGVLTTADGRLIVSDLGSSALLTIDPTTGARSVLTGAGTGTGSDLIAPRGLVAEGGSDALLVADSGAGVLFRVDASGNRTIVTGSGFGSGPALALPYGVALDAGGSLLLIDAGDTGLGLAPALFRVDTTTGLRTLVSGRGVGSGDGLLNPDFGLLVYPSSDTPTPTAVPEPSALAILASAGPLVLGGSLWKRRRHRHRSG